MGRMAMPRHSGTRTRQAITLKSLLLGHHHEYLRQQMYFLHKEQATQWYVEAQHAVFQVS